MTYQLAREVDALYEADVARQWEELNALPEDKYPEWNDAIKSIEKALTHLAKVQDLLYEASNHVTGSSEYDRIESLATSVSDLYDHIVNQRQRMEG